MQAFTEVCFSFEIVSTLIKIKVSTFLFAFCSQHFHAAPSVALLLHSCFLCSVFKVQFPTVVGYGGDNRDRTDDPLLAKQVLSQLSYTPIFFLNGGPKWARTTDLTIISRAL